MLHQIPFQQIALAVYRWGILPLIAVLWTLVVILPYVEIEVLNATIVSTLFTRTVTISDGYELWQRPGFFRCEEYVTVPLNGALPHSWDDDDDDKVRVFPGKSDSGFVAQRNWVLVIIVLAWTHVLLFHFFLWNSNKERLNFYFVQSGSWLLAFVIMCLSLYVGVFTMTMGNMFCSGMESAQYCGLIATILSAPGVCLSCLINAKSSNNNSKSEQDLLQS